MKKNYTFLFFGLLFFNIVNSQNKEIIWSEDFNSYPNLFGIEGSSSGIINIGGYNPSTFTKWELVDNGAALTNFADYTAVFSNNAYPDRHLRAQDTDTGVDWITENIDVSNFVEVTVSLFVGEIGDHEDSEASFGDWFDVWYSFDNGANYTLLPSWNNLGNATHTLTGDTAHGTSCDTDTDFGSTKIFFTIPDSQDNLKLKITLTNGSSSENFILDDINITGVDKSALSTLNNKIDSKALVYPNPSNGVANILLAKNIIKSILIYDVNQRLIKQYKSIYSKKFQLEITSLNTGIYLLQIQDDKNKIRNHKLIIK